MDSTCVSFVVNGEPQPQPRPRFGKGRAYNDKTHPCYAWKQEVNLYARQAFAGREPFDGPVMMCLTFVMPRPTSKEWLRKKPGAGRMYHAARPDIDNLVKAILDSLKNVAWHDDTQVCMLTAMKWWQAVADDEPRVIVAISPPKL